MCLNKTFVIIILSFSANNEENKERKQVGDTHSADRRDTSFSGKIYGHSHCWLKGNIFFNLEESQENDLQ